MDEKFIDMLAEWLLIVGGLNWGLSIWKIDLVSMLLGGLGAMVTTVVYGLVGAAAVWKLYRMFSK